MRKAMCLACVLAFVLVAWPPIRTAAAPRCYPNKRFVVLAGDLVSDALTNLVWQQQASPATMTWAAAKSYCPSGFRLPTIKELSSLVDRSIASPGPTIDQAAFPGAPSADFWTSSPSAGSSSLAWYVEFYSGRSQLSDVQDSMRVRCVRQALAK